jgi:protein TonB
VEFIVDEHGSVFDAHAVNTTDRVFNDAAVRAVSKWRFEPGTVHGEVVRFRMAVPVVFHLET